RRIGCRRVIGRQDSHRESASDSRAGGSGSHDSPEPATDDYRTALRQAAPHFFRPARHLRRRISVTDHRHLEFSYHYMPCLWEENLLQLRNRSHGIIGGGNTSRQGGVQGIHPCHVHPHSLSADTLLLRRVTDKQRLSRFCAKRAERIGKNLWVRLTPAVFLRDGNTLKMLLDTATT